MHKAVGRYSYGLEPIATIILLQGKEKCLYSPFSESILKPLCTLLHAVVAECLGCLAAISTLAMLIQNEEQRFVDGSSYYVG